VGPKEAVGPKKKRSLERRKNKNIDHAVDVMEKTYILA
jgi:hypothetical protein